MNVLWADWAMKIKHQSLCVRSRVWAERYKPVWRRTREVLKMFFREWLYASLQSTFYKSNMVFDFYVYSAATFNRNNMNPFAFYSLPAVVTFIICILYTVK